MRDGAFLQPSEQNTQLTNNDSALVLKQVGLWKMCQQSSKRMFMTEFLLESPQDPATYQEGQESPSFFAWPQLQQLFEEDENMKMVCFDHRATGHCRRKPTGLLTNLPMMERLEHCKEVQLIQLVESFVRDGSIEELVRMVAGLCSCHQYSLKEMLKEDDAPSRWRN